MSTDFIWISGPTRSGKTGRLVEQVCIWNGQPDPLPLHPSVATALVFAANGDNRIELADRIANASRGRSQFDSTTPPGFFQDEVILFYPLLVEQLGLSAQFPLRLRPETEQELATRLWRSDLNEGRLKQEGVSDYFMVRRTLDLLQLAASSGIPLEDIPVVLKDGFAGQEGMPELWDHMGDALLRWRGWCLERGLLTYGIVSELYWRYLLPDQTYRDHLRQRYQWILADDVDEYPAIAHSLFTFFLDQGIPSCFTYNPNGGLRLGLGADPQCLDDLAECCQMVSLTASPSSLGSQWGSDLVQWVSEPMLLPELPDTFRVIQTTSRAQLLRQTAEAIAAAIHAGEVSASEVAVIGPGVDAIARYTLREILTSKGIAVESLNDQQPLASSPMVRALLTLLAIVYPGLGRLLDRDAIAEMLVILSRPPALDVEETGLEVAGIDPVRAGLLTDHCFVPD
ncbi:MAG TPA: recombinase family protein, partial [Crinalium sp.]